MTINEIQYLNEKLTNPFIKKIGDNFEIVLKTPQGYRPWYNDNLGTGFKNPISISSWRVPEKFESAEAARNKIISDVLEFIKLYCTKDRCDLVMGWLKQY